MNAIQTTDLNKGYKNKVAVSGFNLTINKGELFALLGVNGAGKSTVIKMLSCLIKPSFGDAILLGDSITNDPVKVKAKINVSPQETAVAPNLTVRENLELICGIYGHSRAESQVKTSEIIKEFGFEEICNDRAKTLSGGWQRRLSIAMALISEPDILFLDEPTLGLDVLARRELWKMIEGLKGRITIVLTTHYLEEAEALSDRIGIMAKGELVSVGTSAQMMEQTRKENFEDAFVELCERGIA